MIFIWTVQQRASNNTCGSIDRSLQYGSWPTSKNRATVQLFQITHADPRHRSHTLTLHHGLALGGAFLVRTRENWGFVANPTLISQFHVDTPPQVSIDTSLECRCFLGEPQSESAAVLAL